MRKPGRNPGRLICTFPGQIRGPDDAVRSCEGEPSTPMARPLANVPVTRTDPIGSRPDPTSDLAGPAGFPLAGVCALSSAWQRWFGRGLRRPQRVVRRVVRPSLEPLEGRELLSAGDLDPTFGVGGKVLTTFEGSLLDTTETV